MERYVVRIAVRLDGHPPQAVFAFAEDMLAHFLAEDHTAEMSGPTDDQWTFWTEVDAQDLEQAVSSGVALARAAANVASGRTAGQVDHRLWPEHAAPTSVEAYLAAAC